MTIENYTDLVQAVQDWINRTDIFNQVPVFIQTAESKLARKLRIRAMEETLSTAISDSVIAVPDDYREMKALYVATSTNVKLNRLSLSAMFARYPRSGPTGVPRYFARQADNFVFGPVPDSTYTVTGVYYKKITPLSDDNLTNWYTDNAPELLLYGALLEAEPFIKNDERLSVWQSKFDEIWNDIMTEEKAERSSGSEISPLPLIR